MINKKDIDLACKDEAEAIWEVTIIDREIEQLQRKRQAAHRNLMQCKDRVRFLRDEPIEAFADSETLVTLRTI